MFMSLQGVLQVAEAFSFSNQRFFLFSKVDFYIILFIFALGSCSFFSLFLFLGGSFGSCLTNTYFFFLFGGSLIYRPLFFVLYNVKYLSLYLCLKIFLFSCCCCSVFSYSFISYSPIFVISLWILNLLYSDF